MAKLQLTEVTFIDSQTSARKNQTSELTFLFQVDLNLVGDGADAYELCVGAMLSEYGGVGSRRYFITC